MYNFLTDGRKGVSQDPNRVKKVRRKKKSSPTKRKSRISSPKAITELKQSPRRRETSPLANSKQKVGKEERRSRDSRLNKTQNFKRQPESSPTILTDNKAEIPSPKARKKKNRSATDSKRSSRKHPTEISWLKGNPTSTTPKTETCSPTSPKISMTSRKTSPTTKKKQIVPTSSKPKKLKSSNPTKNLVDISSMFGEKFQDIKPNRNTRSPTNEFLSISKRDYLLRQSSATFYLKKFKKVNDDDDDDFDHDDLYDEESDDDGDDEVTEALMKEENITKLSDITKDLSSLDIDDVDLAEFDLNNTLISDETGEICDVDAILTEMNIV